MPGTYTLGRETKIIGRSWDKRLEGPLVQVLSTFSLFFF